MLSILGLDSEVDPALLTWDILIRFLADLDVLSRVRFCDSIDPMLLSTSLARLFNSLPDPPDGGPPSFYCYFSSNAPFSSLRFDDENG